MLAFLGLIFREKPMAPNAPLALNIQEILAQCLIGLANSPRDLLSCSLVASSWTDEAQSHLFRHISIGKRPNDQYTKLQIITVEKALILYEALSSSSRLRRHIRAVSIVLMGSNPINTTICKIGCLGFPQLHETSIFMDKIYPDVLEALICHPTLRTLRLSLMLSSFAGLVDIWPRCAPTLRHVELRWLVFGGTELLDYPAASRPRILIPALRLDNLGFKDDSERSYTYGFALHPFDLSDLRVLSIGTQSELGYLWKEVLPSHAFRACQFLDISYMPFTLDAGFLIDISLLPNLSELRATLGYPAAVIVSMLASIPSQHAIHKISISFRQYDPTAEDYTALDAALLELYVHNTQRRIVFEVTSDFKPTVSAAFPRLKEKYVLKWSENDSWMAANDLWWKPFQAASKDSLPERHRRVIVLNSRSYGRFGQDDAEAGGCSLGTSLEAAQE
ncbi:hypothetical protein R3P38DRAFT_3363235 [Favolaschia claudopus]|uniref:F-box domain-containing protein n=1 Tax=Favolaschia claudopus TaxID=2862362 RepID=A0AAW0AJL4_9AGAR